MDTNILLVLRRIKRVALLVSLMGSMVEIVVTLRALREAE